MYKQQECLLILAQEGAMFLLNQLLQKQIALAEEGFIKPIIKVGNLNSMRTIADVRDAVRAYFMLLTVKPIAGEYYNIGGTYSCKVGDILNDLIDLSSIKDKIIVEEDPERLRPIDADLQIPDTSKFSNHTGWAL